LCVGVCEHFVPDNLFAPQRMDSSWCSVLQCMAGYPQSSKAINSVLQCKKKIVLCRCVYMCVFVCVYVCANIL